MIGMLRTLGTFAFLVFTVSSSSLGESNCSGPTYTEPTCGGACSLADCVDVSVGGDGSAFQCCNQTVVPELPGWVNPFYLALFFSLGLLLFKGRRPAEVFNRRD